MVKQKAKIDQNFNTAVLAEAALLCFICYAYFCLPPAKKAAALIISAAAFLSYRFVILLFYYFLFISFGVTQVPEALATTIGSSR